MNDTTLTRRRLLGAAAATTASALSLPALAQGNGAREIVIGQSAVLSGPLSISLKSVLKGQDMAIDELNRDGGIGGRKLRIVTLDDAYDPKKAVLNATTLIEKDKAVALFGFSSSATVAAVMPLLASKKVPLIGPYGGSPSLRQQHNPYLFTMTASYRDEVVQLVRTLVSAQRTRIAVAYQNHAFGQTMLPLVEEVVKEQGATLVAKHSLDSSGSDAVATERALSEAGPQAVLLVAFGPSTVSFIRATRAHSRFPVYALSIANSKPLLAELGDDARGMAFTQTLPFPWRQTTPLTRDFAAVMAREKLEIDYDHFLGYVNTRVLIEGLRRAGTGNKAITSESLIAGMEAIGKYDMGGFPLNFSAKNHHGANFVEITVVGDGGKYRR
ncbi:MAG: hypothetical protein RLZZ618_3351 [Pseudomonadota bacterium]|jgi:ABC-type branched-subunit amino acid transport system substrate-binding protein